MQLGQSKILYLIKNCTNLITAPEEVLNSELEDLIQFLEPDKNKQYILLSGMLLAEAYRDIKRKSIFEEIVNGEKDLHA